MKNRMYVYAAFGASLLIFGSFLLAYMARTLPPRTVPEGAATETPLPEPKTPSDIPTSVTIDDETPATTTPVAGACVTGGCSGEICGEASEVSGMVSTCIYRAEYACFKYSRCERQMNGTCGWTLAPAYTQCRANPPALE